MIIDEKSLLKSVLDFMNEYKLFTCIDGVNKQQETALHRAVNFQRLDLIDLLLSSGKIIFQFQQYYKYYKY